MKALRYHRYGTAPALEDVPLPSVGPEDVLVHVERAAINPLDIKLLSGGWRQFFDLQLPYTMGSDFTGLVTAAGPGADQSLVGSCVIGRRPPLVGGAFAEYVSVGAEYVTLRPEGMVADAAAGLPTAAGTAWAALFDVGCLTRGQTVLIHAAAGGVGGFAVQFAKAARARVVATASGKGIELAQAYGADEVIDYRTAEFERVTPPVDLVLDTVGFETQRRSFDVLRPGGMLVSVVSSPDEVAARARGVRTARLFYRLEPYDLAALVRRVVNIDARVAIDSVHQLESAFAALERQKSGRAKGKIILNLAQ